MSKQAKPNIVISACRLGIACRYHGRQVASPALVARLQEKYTLVPVCPEVFGGLPTPRAGVDRCANNRCIERGTDRDLTREFERGAKLALQIAERVDAVGAVLVSGSPSCGECGAFTELLEEADIPILHQ